MMQALRDWAIRRLRELDADQSGAVVLLCLASFMILFMTSLVLYDAGKVSYDKVNAQTGADVAAYSQAATKARSMNMLAYANISKRTLVGLHNMYWAMYESWVAWTAKRCSDANCWVGWCWCNPKACADCLYNGVLILWEGSLDWFWFNGLPIAPKVLPMWYSASAQAFEAQIGQINHWQKYMIDFTPWWAWAEASLRGMRNGSSLIGSYPPLDSPVAVASDWVDAVLSLTGGSPSGGTYWLYDQLPVANWKKIFSWPNQNASSVFGGFFSLGIYDPHTGCSSPGFGGFGFNVQTAGSIAEFYSNYEHHKDRSDDGFFIADGPAGPASGWGLSWLLGGFCYLRVNAFTTPSMFWNMAPFNLVAKSNSAEDMSAKSNVIFSYKHAPENRTTLRENYNFMQNYSDYSQVAGAGRAALEGSSGVWALSRGEIVFPEGLRPTGTPNWFGDSTWMWHTGWTAKLRPVALPGEHTSLGFGLDNMLEDVSPFLTLSRTVLGLGASGGYDSAAADGDVAALHKALQAMDEPSMDGLSK